MRKIIDPFLYNAPSLDIHGYERTGARAAIKLFVDENIKMKNKLITIIHGKGEGILKSATHEYLKSDKRVERYYINNYNDGETIVYLK